MGLSRQATGHISQSPDSGGEASYVQRDTRPSWVFRIRHPVGAQGIQRCRVGNFPKARPALGGGSRNPVPDGGVDFGRDGSVRYVGAYPGRDLRCAEERGSGCLPRARIICAQNSYSRTDINC